MDGLTDTQAKVKPVDVNISAFRRWYQKRKKSFFSGMNAESILKIIFEKGEKNNERKN